LKSVIFAACAMSTQACYRRHSKFSVPFHKQRGHRKKISQLLAFRNVQ